MDKCPICGNVPTTKTVNSNINPNNIVEYHFLFGCEKCRLYLPEVFKVSLTLNKVGRIEILDQDRLDVIMEKWFDFIESYDGLENK